jgi:TfoX/Sxy family transcriptional regulator of competence genes
MATSARTVDNLLDQLSGAGDLTAKKMFGEYALYLDGRVVALICDDLLFVKPVPGALRLLEHNPMAPPYPGAKPHLLIDAALDDQDLMVQVLRTVASEVPAPKPKKPKSPR